MWVVVRVRAIRWPAKGSRPVVTRVASNGRAIVDVDDDHAIVEVGDARAIVVEVDDDRVIVEVEDDRAIAEHIARSDLLGTSAISRRVYPADSTRPKSNRRDERRRRKRDEARKSSPHSQQAASLRRCIAHVCVRQRRGRGRRGGGFVRRHSIGGIVYRGIVKCCGSAVHDQAAFSSDLFLS